MLIFNTFEGILIEYEYLVEENIWNNFLLLSPLAISSMSILSCSQILFLVSYAYTFLTLGCFKYVIAEIMSSCVYACVFI